MKPGRPHTAESKAKISATLRGRTFTDEHKANISAARTTGDAVGYIGQHIRVRKVLPKVCAWADETCKGPLHSAFRHDTPAEFVRVDPHNGRYSPRVEDYMRLCVSHHKRYDLKRIADQDRDDTT